MKHHITATATQDEESREIVVQLGCITKTFSKDEVTHPSDAVERTVRWFYGLAPEEIVIATHWLAFASNSWNYRVEFTAPRSTL